APGKRTGVTASIRADTEAATSAGSRAAVATHATTATRATTSAVATDGTVIDECNVLQRHMCIRADEQRAAEAGAAATTAAAVAARGERVGESQVTERDGRRPRAGQTGVAGEEQPVDIGAIDGDVVCPAIDAELPQQQRQLARQEQRSPVERSVER